MKTSIISPAGRGIRQVWGKDGDCLFHKHTQTTLARSPLRHTELIPHPTAAAFLAIL